MALIYYINISALLDYLSEQENFICGFVALPWEAYEELVRIRYIKFVNVDYDS